LVLGKTDLSVYIYSMKVLPILPAALLLLLLGCAQTETAILNEGPGGSIAAGGVTDFTYSVTVGGDEVREFVSISLYDIVYDELDAFISNLKITLITPDGTQLSIVDTDQEFYFNATVHKFVTYDENRVEPPRMDAMPGRYLLGILDQSDRLVNTVLANEIQAVDSYSGVSGEAPNGDWILRFENLHETAAGSLGSWGLEFDYRVPRN
jgi:hypothetical protein